MPGARIPELTQRAIQKAYRNGEGSHAKLAERFGVSHSTVKRICKGITPATPAAALVTEALATGQAVTIGGIDIGQFVSDAIADLTADMKRVEPKSKEGLATAALKYMMFYRELNPPSLKDLVDQLLAREDFEPEKFVRILKTRYAAKVQGQQQG
jgi:transcriptional regulator with XRE-family HTH domain